METISDEQWFLSMDGSSNASGFGAGLVLSDSRGMVAEYVLRFNFRATNNEAKYEALIIGLRVAKKARAMHLKVSSGLQLVMG